MNKLVIYGRPTTKKNSSRVIMSKGYPRVLPSKAFTDYERDSLKQLQFFRKRSYTPGPISIRCRYYMPDFRWWPDLVGLLQATSDILTKAEIIDDDMWIVDYDGSCIAGIDKSNPRVEIEIEPFEGEGVLHDIRKRRGKL